MKNNMNADELKKQFIERDRLIRAVSRNGKFRIALIRNTNTVKTANDNHNISSFPAYFLAKTLTATSLMASFLKGEERINIDIEGSGSIKRIYAEALQLGEVRGFTIYDNNLESISNMSELIGKGNLRVVRVLYNKKEPLVSVVPLQKGDISTDISHYFYQSEQIPTVLILDIEPDEDGNIVGSAGLMVQALPGADINHLIMVDDSLSDKGNLLKYLSEEPDLEVVLNTLIPIEFDIVKTTPIDFFCRCSKDNFIDKLITLNLNEIKDMQDKGHNQLVCHYCNKKYLLEREDFNKIIEEISSKMN